MFYKETQLDLPNKCVLQSLNVAFIANSADPDGIQETTKLPIIRLVLSSNAPEVTNRKIFLSETTRP